MMSSGRRRYQEKGNVFLHSCVNQGKLKIDSWLKND